jgi:hypothetical protein
MPLISPDFSEAAGLKPGEYVARIAASTLKKSQAGNDYVSWQLTTAGNPDIAANDQVVYYNTPFTGRGAFRFRKFVEAAVGEPLGEALASFNTDELHGRSVVITVEANPKSTWPDVTAVRSVM